MISTILFTCIAFTVFSVSYAEYNVALYCQLVPIGTKFPSLVACDKFYICLEDGQYAEANCGHNQIFDKDAQYCLPALNTNCNANVQNPCENQQNVWVADDKACGNWHYCRNGNIQGSGTCGKGLIFDYNQQKCVTGLCLNDDHLSNYCDIMPENEFFADFEDCTAWRKCNGRKVKSGNCGKGLLYDSQKQMCVYSNNNTCGGPTEHCDANSANKKLPDELKCSNYFMCTQEGDKWYWIKMQCSGLEYYDNITNSCQSRQTATPVPTCDRCQYSNDQWVNAVDPTCQTYLICSDGVKTDSKSCPSGIFNEQKQSCVSNGNLDSYSKQNGACAALGD